MPPLSFSRRTAAGVPLRPAFAALMLAALLPMGCGTGNAPGAAVQPAPAAIQPEAATLSDDRGAPPPPPPLPEPGALVGRGFAQVAGQVAHGRKDGQDFLRVVQHIVRFLPHFHQHVDHAFVVRGEP